MLEVVNQKLHLNFTFHWSKAIAVLPSCVCVYDCQSSTQSFYEVCTVPERAKELLEES